MTTAHRPTFDPARGKDAQRGPAYHQRLLPAHSVLKTRREGQGTVAETSRRDLRTQLLQAEAAHLAKARGEIDSTNSVAESETGSKRRIEAGEGDAEIEEEDIDSKRQRILEETRDIDADSDESEEDSSEEESDEEDDLMREVEKIRREKAEQREREVRLILLNTAQADSQHRKPKGRRKSRKLETRI